MPFARFSPCQPCCLCCDRPPAKLYMSFSEFEAPFDVFNGDVIEFNLGVLGSTGISYNPVNNLHRTITYNSISYEVTISASGECFPGYLSPGREGTVVLFNIFMLQILNNMSFCIYGDDSYRPICVGDNGPIPTVNGSGNCGSLCRLLPNLPFMLGNEEDLSCVFFSFLGAYNYFITGDTCQPLYDYYQCNVNPEEPVLVTYYVIGIFFDETNNSTVPPFPGSFPEYDMTQFQGRITISE